MFAENYLYCQPPSTRNDFSDLLAAMLESQNKFEVACQLCRSLFIEQYIKFDLSFISKENVGSQKPAACSIKNKEVFQKKKKSQTYPNASLEKMFHSNLGVHNECTSLQPAFNAIAFMVYDVTFVSFLFNRKGQCD